MNNYIKIKNIYKKYEKNKTIKVLNDISFNFEAGKTYSIVGPSGSGKTTIARLLAKQIRGEFYQISAVFSGVSDLKKIFNQAKTLRDDGISTILFVDEIHRSNRTQQDIFLPYFFLRF